MKALQLILPILLFSVLAPVASQASVVAERPAATDRAAIRLEAPVAKGKSEAKLSKRAAKKINKLLQRIEERTDKVDFNDPVDKWMWFWIFGWGAGLLFSILASVVFIGTGFGIFWLLSSAAWLFGTVALVIWLVKKFE